MSDALGIFFNQLLQSSGKEARNVSIISDNAKRTDVPPRNGRRRPAPRRSVSTPLHHMSRWESPSKFDFDSMNPSSSQLRTNDSSFRWDSMPEKRNRPKSMGLTRPQRQSSDDGFFSNSNSMSDKLVNQKTAAFFGRGMTVNDMTSTSLPKSLRSLPY